MDEKGSVGSLKLLPPCGRDAEIYRTRPTLRDYEIIYRTCEFLRLTVPYMGTFSPEFFSESETCRSFPTGDVHFCLDAKTNQKDHGGEENA
jgi:hypothetical protein